MARGSASKMLMIVGLGFGGAYLGVFGKDLQTKAQDIIAGGRRIGGDNPALPGTTGSRGGNYGPTGTGGYAAPGGIHNPNFWQQAREWQAAAQSKDWGSFRQHVMAIGAPDPGPSAPSGW